jgi:hypothetical protein
MIRAGYIIARSENFLPVTLVRSVSMVAGIEQKSDVEKGDLSELDC